MASLLNEVYRKSKHRNVSRKKILLIMLKIYMLPFTQEEISLKIAQMLKPAGTKPGWI